MVKSAVLLVTISLTFLTACESRQTQTNLPAPNGNGKNQSGQDQSGQYQNGSGPAGQDGQGAAQNGNNADAGGQLGSSIPITLDAKELKQRYALDTSNLTYHFKYQTTDTTGAINFTGDKATLTFSGLKANVKSDLLLELLQGSAVKLRGEVKDLVLQPGAQRIDLKLSPVDGAGGDLTIDVTVDQPGSGSTGSGTDTATNTGGNTNTNTGGNTDTGTSTNTGTNTNTNTGGNTNTNTGTNTGGDTNTNTVTNTGGNTGGNTNTNTGGGTSGVSFAKDAKPIFDEYCVECHHPGAQFPDLTKAPDSGLFGVIVNSINAGRMPKAPRDPMPKAKLDKLIEWNKAGSPP